MDVPWKVILAFLGVFVAGAVFGGVFTLGVSARRFAHVPRQPATVDRSLTQFPAVPPPKAEVAGPPGPKAAVATTRATNPITPVLMNQFTRKLSGLSAPQKESLRKILGRAGEDYHRLRQENFADVARITERMYADVSGVLTLEQRSELENMRKQMEEKLQAERKKRSDAAAAEAASRAATGAPGSAPKGRAAAPEGPQGIAK
jgi:hypothetical protein